MHDRAARRAPRVVLSIQHNRLTEAINIRLSRVISVSPTIPTTVRP